MRTVRSPVALAVSLAVFGAMGMVRDVNTTTMRQQRTPVPPLGALLSGADATAWGTHTPARLAAALFVASVGTLIPALRADVSVVVPDDRGTTARVPS